jgi:spermidine synthase
MLLNYKKILFLTILIEGFVTLATELLAIRQSIPFVGSGTETISILISTVLLPLAVGYYYGGKVYAQTSKSSKFKSVRKILINNLLLASIIITFGLSYFCLESFFSLLQLNGITNRIIQTSLYGILFLVYPTFLLGQTIPLISNYFNKLKIAHLTGRMLFFSTLGSFLGSVVTTLVLMSTIGVNNTVIVNIGLLVLLILLLQKGLFTYEKLTALSILGIAMVLNSDHILKTFNIVEMSNYNTISIIELPKEEAKILSLNRGYSAKYTKDPKFQFLYVQYINKLFLEQIKGQKKSILIIGAGGFTMGQDDKTNLYTYVDIDKSLKEIAEKHLFGQKLSPNKAFIAEPAESFLRYNTKKYDFIILDAYSNGMNIPFSLVTKEFFELVKKSVADDGIILANIVTMPNLSDKFSIRVDNTFRSVFPNITRQVMGGFMPWAEKPAPANVLYIYYNNQSVASNEVYTNDLNTSYKDQVY